MDLAHCRLTPDWTFSCFWRRHELRQRWYTRVPCLVCAFFPAVFFSSKVTRACLIIRVIVGTTTTICRCACVLHANYPTTIAEMWEGKGACRSAVRGGYFRLNINSIPYCTGRHRSAQLSTLRLRCAARKPWKSNTRRWHKTIMITYKSIPYSTGCNHSAQLSTLRSRRAAREPWRSNTRRWHKTKMITFSNGT